MSNQELNQTPAAVKTEAYVEVDKNMLIETVVNEPDIKYYDVRREKTFSLYNFYEP